MEISKKKEAEKEKEDEVDQAIKDWGKDPEDSSRLATVRETFDQICHIKEFIHQALKEDDQKWRSMRRIDNERIDAIIRLNRAQDNRIKVLEKVAKNYSEGDLKKYLRFKLN